MEGLGVEQRGQHGGPVSVGANAPSSAEEAFTVLAQGLWTVVSLTTESEGQVQLTGSLADLGGETSS